MASLEVTSRQQLAPAGPSPGPATATRRLPASGTPPRPSKRPQDATSQGPTPKKPKVLLNSDSVNVLTLQQRVEVIKKYEKGNSCRKLGVEYKCGKSQISKIVRDKERIMAKFNEGFNPQAKILIPRRMPYEELDKRLFDYFCRARNLGYIITGPGLIAEANQYSMEMGLDGFQASTGWLDSFKRRHNIKFATLSGESADVPAANVEEYQHRLPEICQGYSLRDIFNIDESGLFYRQLQCKSLVHAKDPRKGGKGQKLKDRITVIFGCSAMGEKLKLTVIGRSKSPRSFRGKEGINPVRYRYNNKAWTTSAEFEAYLSWLNNKMISQGRKILLFLDNAPGHGHHSFSNIKLEFLPPNTTSKLQPLDAGIIAQVKALYRKRMLRNISFNIQQNIPASEAAKKIDIFTAIEWLSLAWSGVSDLNIKRCFKKVGFSQMHIDPASDSTADPDFESDVTPEMRQLIDVSFREFINLESDEIIHPLVAEQGTLQADTDVVPDDYQPDEVMDPAPQHKTTIAEDINNLDQIKKKAAKWGDAALM